ncbi:MAG: NAD-dependent epimerase/dehydratase family protein [Deltaproteobacteria bacterium]|nr:NAD-dependent epimerase/dehydratase family protein [Deltaproteobacteria bacterium]
MKILVTGGNGFLGRHVCRRLRDAGHEVAALCQEGTSTEGMEDLAAVVPGDLTDPEDLVEALEGREAVVHLAALVAEWGRFSWYHRVNVQGTRSLADCAVASGVRRLVFMSSLAVHGTGSFDGGDEAAPRDACGNPYAASKIAAEDLLKELHRRGDLETVILRPGMVPFGEGDLRGFAPLARTIASGRMPVTGDPGRLVCSVYAPNLAEGVRLALEKPEAAGGTFVLTDDIRLTWDAFFQGIAGLLGTRLRYRRIPLTVAKLGAAVAETLWLPFGPRHRPPLTRYLVRLMTRDLHFACEAAKRTLGYRPVTGFEEGLARTVEWWRGTRNSGTLTPVVGRDDAA